MKILYLSTPSFADCDFPLVKALMEKGHDVTYMIELSPCSKRATLFDIKNMIPKNGIINATEYEELRVFSNFMPLDNVYILNQTIDRQSSFTALKNTLELCKFIKQNNFDVIHTDGHFEMWRVLLYWFSKKIVRTVHDPLPHSDNTSFRSRFFRFLNFSFVRKLVILNERQYKPFKKKYNINDDRILINRLGIYDNICDFAVEKTDSVENNVLFFGRISVYKGVEYLCQAFEKVRKAIPDATLTIAGGGKIYFDDSFYKDKSYITVHNHYIGNSELARLLQACTITCCPYVDATQSGVVMTSFAMLKPVLVTNVGGLPDMVHGGKAGVIVPPKDADAIANAIIDMLENKKKLNGMKDYISQTFFKGDYSWSKIADKYLDFYEKC